MAAILIIDDDTFICKAIQKQLANKGYLAEIAFSGNSGLEKLKKQSFDLVLCDYRLPDKNGLDMLKEIKRIYSRIPVVIITAYADVRMAVKLMKQGATDYMAKPLQHEEILSLAKKLTSGKGARNSLDAEYDFIEGKSQVFLEALKYAKIVAPTGMSVVIEGETGTGKEYVARYIHRQSKRNGNPFVAVDCGAIPKELAGSELFGHVKGSFTGAVADKTGVFQQANGGTLFLDEIGNLGYSVQVQLLRTLQEKTVTRIGENKPARVDVRIIVASNENLGEMVERNQFREDLLHRINEFKIVLPPLRERGEDIVSFARHFLKRANSELQLSVDGFAEETLEILGNYEWPGNIRELKNVVKRAVLLSSGNLVTPEVLPSEIVESSKLKNPVPEITQPQEVATLKMASNDAEKETIIKAIEDAGYNKSKAAQMLQIDRKTLYNKIRQYGIDI